MFRFGSRMHAVGLAWTLYALMGCSPDKSPSDPSDSDPPLADSGSDADSDTADASGGDSSGGTGDGMDPVEGIDVGQVPPDFTLLDADGGPVSLSDFAGMRIILMGNAEWCAGCQELAAKMQEWYAEDALDDQIIVGVLVQDSTGAQTDVEDAARWRDRFGLTHPVLADPQGEWAAMYGIEGEYGQRSYMVIDSSGVITWTQRNGERARRADLKEQINAAQ